MKPLSFSTISTILSLLDSGYAHRETADRAGVSIGSVSLVRNQHRFDMPKPPGGCPKKLMARHPSWHPLTWIRKGNYSTLGPQDSSRCHSQGL